MLNFGNMFNLGHQKMSPQVVTETKPVFDINNFNKNDFNLVDTINGLRNKTPKNYDEEIKYYEIFEAIQKKMGEIYSRDTAMYKQMWGNIEDELYAKCSEVAEDIIKGVKYN